MHSMLSISIYLGAFLSVSNSFGTVYLFSSLFGHFSCLQLFWDILSLFTAMSATLSTSISTSMLATLSTYMFNNPITTAITNHHCHISKMSTTMSVTLSTYMSTTMLATSSATLSTAMSATPITNRIIKVCV